MNGHNGPQAMRISGLHPQARFSFVNDVYEPLQITHNDRQCYVARGVASRYLFFTGKTRWVISKVLDDGYKCWAYMEGKDLEHGGRWTVCDANGQWKEDHDVSCTPVPADTDKFFQLRMTLDADMRKYGLIDKVDLKKLWRKLDYNGNNIVSLAEIDKMVVELVAGGAWPAWLNNKPALMRAYKKTIVKDGDGDDWVQKREFHDLLLNIFWFNKLWKVFEEVDSAHDRRIDVGEFTRGLSNMGVHMSPQDAQQEFAKVDTNGGGQVLFVEFCAWVRHRVNPDSHPEFDADIISGENCGRTTRPHHHRHTAHHHGNHAAHHAAHHTAHHATQHSGYATRDIDFSAYATNGSSSAGSVPVGGRQDSLRSAGTGAALDHHVKPKAMSDFDEVEDKIKSLCKDHSRMKAMWSMLDFNGNGIVSLAEIDKWVVENYELLNHKPALMRCYKCTIIQGSHHDDWVHRSDFKRLVVNIFYFNKLYWLFDQANGDDRRMDLQEFKMCLSLCGCKTSDAASEFRNVDRNGGGQILFDEFCHYICGRMCPPGMTDMMDDHFDRTKHDGTGAVLQSASHGHHHGHGHSHGHGRSHSPGGWRPGN